MNLRQCPECEGERLYATETQTWNHTAVLWPRLGGFWGTTPLLVVVCSDCGLTRFYVGGEGREKMKRSAKWRPV
ncbi:MAG: hypothetical protein HY301_07175 [Verrucomicrobia bacterium]|nr:hypothetical protein [Verrucomicrobiota bacterium]